MKLHAVILAGGQGERFWPSSRSHRPKQFLDLLGDGTLLEGTVRRISRTVPSDQIWIVAGSNSKSAIAALGLPVPAARMLWEPVGRNTAAAIGAAAERVLLDGDGDLLILPSDHWISDAGSFWETVEAGRQLLDGPRVITFGIVPTYAETGYGYIERGAVLDPLLRAWRVSRFHEKPDVERAEAYLNAGGCYWNAGIFLFAARTIADLLRKHVPAMAPVLDRLRDDLRAGMTDAGWLRYFENSPSMSIDNAVMEKAESVAVVEARFGWSDLGSWTALGEHIDPDDSGNRARGSVLVQESEDCILVSAEGGLLAVLGVKDLIVVRTPDATLVCPKDRAQDVRRLVREGKIHAVFRQFF